MKKYYLMTILLLLAASDVYAADMYRCATANGVAYQSSPCGGEKISFTGGALVSEGAKLQSAPAVASVGEQTAKPKPRPASSTQQAQTTPPQKTLEWALDLYKTAAGKARKCQQSLRKGTLTPCLDFASFTQGNSDFMQAFEYLNRYGQAGLENLLLPDEREHLAKDSSDILAIAGQLEEMIKLVQ